MGSQDSTAVANKPVDEQRRLPQALSADVRRHFDAHDLGLLEKVLTEPVAEIDHPALHEPDAVEAIFGVSAELTRTDGTRFPAPEPIAGGRAAAATRVPTLKTAEEHKLFLRINCARMHINRILDAYADQALPLPVVRELLAWTFWEQDVRARIVELNMPLVLAMAKRTRLAGIDFNEMISEGNMALLRSVDKFDCGRGFKFSTYACRAILKSFSRVAMRTSRYRGTFPVEFDPSIERSDHLERKRQSAEADCVDDLKEILRRNMADLTEVEQTVIRQRFALDHVGAEIPVPKTLEQVGQVIGVTKERVRQIQNKALKKIRTALEESYLAA